MDFISVWPTAAVLGLLLLLAAVAARRVPFYREHLVDPGHRFQTLDGLRGLLASGVFVHHGVITYFSSVTGEWTHVEGSNFYSNLGPTAVKLFFMITGLLFWDRILGTDGRVDWSSFFSARLKRLVPMYTVSTTLVLLVAFAETGFRFHEPLKQVAASMMSWYSFGLRGFTDVNGFGHTARIAAAAYWTLTYEWVFYLSLPFLSAFRRPGPFLVLMTWAAVYLYALVGVPPVLWFMIGMGTAVLLRQRPGIGAVLKHPGCGVLAVAALGLSLALPREGGLKLLHLPLEALFFVVAAGGNSLGGLLTWPGSRVLGLASYSLYVLHGLLLYGSNRLWPMRGYGPVGFWLQMGACGALLLGASLLTFRWIEWPFIKKRAPPPPEPAP